MNTRKTLQKIARRLHRSLFLAVPNDGKQYVDLSKLPPAQDRSHLLEVWQDKVLFEDTGFRLAESPAVQ